MKFMGPMIVVTDMKASRKFYEELLGQKVMADLGANVAYQEGPSLQTLESWAQFIEKTPGDIRLKGNDAELYFEEEDLDGFLRRLEAWPGVALVHPAKEQEWGQRVVRFYDPDGHVVEVGESLPIVVRRFLAQGMSAEEVSKRTMMPLEFVRMCMQ